MKTNSGWTGPRSQTVNTKLNNNETVFVLRPSGAEVPKIKTVCLEFRGGGSRPETLA